MEKQELSEILDDSEEHTGTQRTKNVELSTDRELKESSEQVSHRDRRQTID